jgi:hypothetical protein
VRQIQWRLRRVRELKEAISAAILASRAAGWSETTHKKNEEILLVAVALNHPTIARGDIDSFGSLKVRDGELNELWQHAAEQISGDHELTADQLRDGLNDRLNEIVERLWSSTIDRRHYAHLANDEGFARLIWRGARARHELPEIEREHEEAVRQWAEEGTAQSHAAMLEYKNEIARLRTDRDMVEAFWERSVTTELTAG